ncbi:nuclease HARBI1 [Trichonephila clavipes]|nr:nuclease HARBI1 [Trichonephila clavipes]
MNTIQKVSTVTELEFLENQEIRKVRKLVGRSNLFEELNDYEFQRRFRLTKQSVAELTLLIEEKLESKTPCNNALNPVEQVLIALRFYAVACMQLAIADLFDVSQPTVYRVVHRVSEAIASLLPDFIHLPVNREECKTRHFLDVVTSSMVVNPHFSIHDKCYGFTSCSRTSTTPSIVPEFLRSTSCKMTSARGHGAIVYCLNSGSEDRQMGRHNGKVEPAPH